MKYMHLLNWKLKIKMLVFRIFTVHYIKFVPLDRILVVLINENKLSYNTKEDGKQSKMLL